ncbi:hypothetical protein MLD38_028399 [Melastoma candidum]|uniref:Uncharacterized protein n=1 Tax=Melastoma candidum TaxID=119954 RepID=A0ACB9N2P3_9MYRT|nr:hypothetical protein MLD38_028399 [Melastoma candidum]
MGVESGRVVKWGYLISTSSDDCVSAINEYYDQVLSYGRERSVILDAVKLDESCVLANVLAAHFLCSYDPSRVPARVRAAEDHLDQSTPYEKAVYNAIRSLISENRDNDVAFEEHRKLLAEYPKDLVSLKRAQILCFYMGQPDLSLNLVEQILPQNAEESYIYGMLAFPLLELGRMDDAEKASKKAFEINNRDCWAQHNLCHVYQYNCQLKDAVEFMEKCAPTWSSCSSFMITHNWWHVALCYLEGSAQISKVLDIYDSHIWKELERPDAVNPEVYLNALGLLLRLSLRDHTNSFGDRLNVLASCVEKKENWYIEWHLDILIIWALAFSGKLSVAEELLDNLKSRFSLMNKKKQLTMQQAILLAEAMYEFGNGHYKQGLDMLGLDFDAISCKRIGASDEQLDVFNEVYYSMLLNTGQVKKATEAIEKRVKKTDASPFLWHLLERCYRQAGRVTEAEAANKKVRALETAAGL